VSKKLNKAFGQALREVAEKAPAEPIEALGPEWVDRHTSVTWNKGERPKS